MPLRLKAALCGALCFVAPLPAFADDPFQPLTSGQYRGFSGFQFVQSSGSTVLPPDDPRRTRDLTGMFRIVAIISFTSTNHTH